MAIWQPNAPTPGSSLELVPKTTLASAKFNLIDHYGNPITEKILQGSPAALFFGFTHCPDICPTTLWTLDQYLSTLSQEGFALPGFFITVDPLRDTPEVMKEHLANFNGTITGITGSSDEIKKLLKNWKVYTKIVPLEGTDYTIDHTASVYLIDANGILRDTLKYQESRENSLVKLRQFLTASK
tara:strand:+ start:4554 stop:5105 length:552 start_codon:yes stop_codon:yes gene_type:complete